ncbi:MAG: hypothetical protein ABIR32_21305 [Ilumatobacteraceae bacterium]
MRTSGLRRNRLLLFAALAGLIVGAVVIIAVVRSRDEGDAAQPPTVWEAITDGIVGGEVPLETALQAFSYSHDLPMPGVQIPAGVDDDDVPTSGTGPLSWAGAVRDQMTAAQRAVFDDHLAIGPEDVVIPIGADDVPAAIDVGEAQVAPADGATSQVDNSTGSGPRRRVHTSRLAASATVDPQRGPSVLPDGLEERIKAELVADLVRIGGRLGLPVLRDSWFLGDLELVISGEDGGNTQMETHPVYDPGTGKIVPCKVTVFKNMWSKESGGNALSSTFHVVMTHEAVHCYQYAVATEFAPSTFDPKWVPFPPWISEGTAIWLAADDTQIAEPMVPGMWKTHILGQPEKSLSNRSYDAFGLYALLAHLGRDLWGNMVAAWRAALNISGISVPEAFLGPLGGDKRDVAETWGPWHLREPSWQEPWITTGFGLPADANTPRTEAVATRSGTTDTLPSRANAVRSVVFSEAEIIRIETNGTASVHDGKQNTARAFTTQRLCVKGDCICPEGTDRAGERAVDGNITTPFVLTVTAQAGGAEYTLQARTLEEECGVQPTTTTSGGDEAGATNVNCRGGCAMSNGDPHLVTVDGVTYDLMAAGEFVLLRNADATLEAHVRQAPYEGSDHVTINTALALLVDGHRIQFDVSTTDDLDGAPIAVDGNDVRVRLDGTDLTVGDRTTIGPESSLTSIDEGFQVDAPDGTIVRVLGLHAYGLNIMVEPSDGVRASSVGLVGTSAATGARLPPQSDGTIVPAVADPHEFYVAIYTSFADSWRITDQDSLFTYDAGESTSSHTIEGFPREEDLVPIEQLTPEQRAVGEQACAGIDDPVLHAHCVYDAAVTGAAGFGDLYESSENILVAAVVEPESVDEAFPPLIRLPDVTTLWGRALASNGTLYLSVEDDNANFALLAVDALDGTIRSRAELAGGGTVVLAAGSVWVDGIDGLGSCKIGRFDAETLAAQATVASATCVYGNGSGLVSTTDAAWWLDGSALMADGTGQVIRRIDPTDNVSEAGLELPAGTDRVFGAPAALYAFSPDGSVWSSTDDDAFVRTSIATTRGLPTGSGLWAQAADPSSFTYFTPDGTPSGTVNEISSIDTADDDAIYATRSFEGNLLTRIPRDGSDDAVIARSATIETVNGESQLSYDNGVGTQLAADLLVHFWQADSPDGSFLYWQAIDVRQTLPR